MMNMILPGLWMVDVPDWFLAPNTNGDYGLSPRRAPDSSYHRRQAEGKIRSPTEPSPRRGCTRCRGMAPRERTAGPSSRIVQGLKLDCEDDAWDRRGVNPDGHPGSPLPAPLQDRLRRPAVREHQEVQQQHRRGAGVRQEVSPQADGGQDQGVLHGRQEALLHADLVAQCSVMLCGSLCCSSPPYQTQPMCRSAFLHFY